METLIQNFGRDELVRLKLRALYERRGFRRVKTGKFEEYALYVENKNFLETDSIITFMDLDGKLLALKPDVTLSIIKNIPKKAMPAAQKVYYIDEVYRLSPESREYKVHNQIGVELIGDSDGFSNLEIIDLALESLWTINQRFALDISHLGFISGLLSELKLSHRLESALLENIHAKNSWDIAQLLEQAEAPEEKVRQVLLLATLHGGFSKSLAQARELVCNDEMRAAYDELAQMEKLLKSCGANGNVNLDFSVVNDLDYYNGLIFRGYVEGVPTLVLTGGRYDNLMKRMGKHNGAIGFGISLDELGTYLKSGRQYNFDILITYSATCDFAALLAVVRERFAEKQVRLEREGSDLAAAGLTFRQHLRYRDGKLEEVASC